MCDLSKISYLKGKYLLNKLWPSRNKGGASCIGIWKRMFNIHHPVMRTVDIETSKRKNPKNIKGHLVQKLISFHHNKRCPYCPTSSHSVIILRVLSKDSSVVLLALSCSDSNSLSWGPASAPAPAAPAAAILLLDYVTGAGKSQDAKHLKHTTELIKFWHSFFYFIVKDCKLLLLLALTLHSLLASLQFYRVQHSDI